MLSRQWVASFFLALFSMGLQASPSIEAIFSPADSYPSDPIYGFDGRLYGKLNADTPGFWSTNADGSDYQLVVTDFGFSGSEPDTTPLAHNHRGQMYMGIAPGNVCPRYDKVEGVIVGRNWGAIVQYTPWAEDPDERVKDITTPLGHEICPVGNMVFDTDDNLYFISEAIFDDAVNAGTKIYQLTPDGELTAIKEFVSEEDVVDGSAHPDGYEPSDLYISSDGQTIFGFNASGGSGTQSAVFQPGVTSYKGTIFQIDISDDFAFSVVRDVQFDEDFQSPAYSAVFFDEHLFYTTTGFPPVGTASGSLNDLDLSLSTPSWSAAAVFANQSAPLGRSPRALALGLDDAIYGVTIQGGTDGKGTLYQFVPGSSQNDITTLHSFLASGDLGVNPDQLAAGWDGNLYGAATKTNSSLIFKADPDSTINAPVIRAFWTETPELEWQGSGTEVTLNWDVTNPSGAGTASCTASGDWSTAINDLADGTATVFVDHQGTNEYQLSCDNGVDSSARLLRVNAAVEADPVVIVSFTANATRLTQGDTLTFSWQTKNAASCEANWGVISNTDVDIGTHSFEPNPGDHTFQFRCTGLSGGEVSSSEIRVSVAVANPVDGAGSLSLWVLLSICFMMLLYRRADSV